MPDRDDIDKEDLRNEKVDDPYLNSRLPTASNNDTRVKARRLPVMMNAADCILGNSEMSIT